MAFAEELHPDVNVVALVDFDNDCVATSLACARALGERLWGVRLDTSETMVDRSLWDSMGQFRPDRGEPAARAQRARRPRRRGPSFRSWGWGDRGGPAPARGNGLTGRNAYSIHVYRYGVKGRAAKFPPL